MTAAEQVVNPSDGSVLAEVAMGGAAAPMGEENGYCVEPAQLEGPDDNVCCREEIFGPCAYLLCFKDEESAIAKVNELAYGLANSVWSSDLTRANNCSRAELTCDTSFRMLFGVAWNVF